MKASFGYGLLAQTFAHKAGVSEEPVPLVGIVDQNASYRPGISSLSEHEADDVSESAIVCLCLQSLPEPPERCPSWTVEPNSSWAHKHTEL